MMPVAWLLIDMTLFEAQAQSLLLDLSKRKLGRPPTTLNRRYVLILESTPVSISLARLWPLTPSTPSSPIRLPRLGLTAGDPQIPKMVLARSRNPPPNRMFLWQKAARQIGEAE